MPGVEYDMGGVGAVALRPVGVDNGYQATSISELEMFDRFTGLCSAGDIALLEREGYIRDGKLTALGEKTRAEERANWAAAHKKHR